MELFMEESYEMNMDSEALEKAEYTNETACCSKCHEGERDIPAPCNSVFYQTDLVSVPVKVVPYAKAGPCTTVCCGSPVVTAGDACLGEVGQVCEFTITQKICVKLPLHFGASILVDRAKVQCGNISEAECDCKNHCIRKCD